MRALIAVVALLFNAPPAVEKPVVEIGQCDPVNGERPFRWTREKKDEVRARVRRVCKHVRASEHACDFLDSLVVRESYGGMASVRHTKGEGEHGLGPMGLSLRWHRDKWPGDDEDPMFCTPEASALVALEIMHRAVRKWGADNWAGVQAIYSGSFYNKVVEETGERWLSPKVTTKIANRICSPLRLRGVSCWEHVDVKDLGRRVPLKERKTLALELAESYEAPDALRQ